MFNGPSEPFSVNGGSCNNLPVVLQTGQSCDLVIGFNPTGATDFADTIEIVSNAVSSPDVVQLRGTSIIAVVPALNHYGLGLMVLLLGMMSAWYFRKKVPAGKF